MATPQEPSDHDLFLAELGSSDESVEELLSGGADIDELIAAGVLDDDEPAFQDDGDDKAIEIASSALSDEEIRARLDQRNNWLVANGHRSLTWRSERSYGQLSNRAS